MRDHEAEAEEEVEEAAEVAAAAPEEDPDKTERIGLVCQQEIVKLTERLQGHLAKCRV